MLPKECITRLITNHSILLCLVDCFSERHCSKHAVGPWGWTHGVAQGCFFGLGCISCGICYFYLFAITRHILLIIKITGNTVSIYIELQQMRSGHVEVFGGVPTSYMGFRYTAIWSLCNKGSFIYLFIYLQISLHHPFAIHLDISRFFTFFFLKMSLWLIWLVWILWFLWRINSLFILQFLWVRF